MNNIYTADFETTIEEPTRVWLWSYHNVNYGLDESYGGNIEDFFYWLLNQGADIVYLHNLKFDGSFICYYLLTNNWKLNKTKEHMSFDTLISEMGQWYSITLYYYEKKIEIRDSLKKLPMSVERIAKAFKYPENKGSIEFKRDNYDIITENDKKYVLTDSRIVAHALQEQFANGLDRLTVGSDALNSYRGTKSKSYFENFFPILDFELDGQIRSAYRGGYTYLNYIFAGKDIKEGIILDVNSMYPYCMRYKDLPIGNPVLFSGEYKYDKEYPLYIIRFEAIFEVKKGYLPTVQIKKNPYFIGTEYQTSVDDFVELTMTNVDYELFCEHHEIYEIHFICGYKFKSMTGLFNDYIDYWMQIKRTEEGGKREIAKLMLNSLYGKFAKNPRVTQRYPIIEEGKLKLVRGADEFAEPIYVPIACYITAWARYTLITSAQQVYDRFIYADTDSLHLTGNSIPDILMVDDTKLGAWKLEAEFSRARFIRAKRYVEEIKGELHVKCAGMPENVKKQVTWDNFQRGSIFTGKLLPHQVPGGVILKPHTFTLF